MYTRITLGGALTFLSADWAKANGLDRILLCVYNIYTVAVGFAFAPALTYTHTHAHKHIYAHTHTYIRTHARTYTYCTGDEHYILVV